MEERNGTVVSDNASAVLADYPFTRRDVRVGLIAAYTLVFCCCFFGNLMIITVITLHRRMRVTTHFFMANLAVADICVSIFCVYQNLSFYLASKWAFGEFLCKMYHFINGLSYTASVLILTVITLERYIVILHPFWTRRFVTTRRLRLVVLVVWLLSAVYNSPRLIVYGTVQVPSMTEENESETLCVLLRAQYNSREYDLFNFIILFSLPILLMCILYSAIVRRLWSRVETLHRRPLHHCRSPSAFFSSLMADRRGSESVAHSPNRIVTPTESNISQALSESELLQHINGNGGGNLHRDAYYSRMDDSLSRRILMTRKRVIRLLLAVFVSFIICNLPFHARKFWQYWSPHYDGGSTRSAFLTIGTTLILYMNSGINPFLYATLSTSFQRALKDVVLCRRYQWRTGQRATNALQITNAQTSV